MNKLTMLAAAILLTWASCGEGKDVRQIAYDSLPSFDKECQGGAWAFAPAVEGKVTMEEGRPTFIGNDESACAGVYSCKLAIWPMDDVVLQERQPLTMVCFEDCTHGALGPACAFVDVSAGATVGFIMRM
jgi:hypothetical protein